MARTNEKTRTLRCDDETWKRVRLAALEDDMTIGEELGALLVLRDHRLQQDAMNDCNECQGGTTAYYCWPCELQYVNDD